MHFNPLEDRGGETALEEEDEGEIFSQLFGKAASRGRPKTKDVVRPIWVSALDFDAWPRPSEATSEELYGGVTRKLPISRKVPRLSTVALRGGIYGRLTARRWWTNVVEGCSATCALEAA